MTIKVTRNGQDFTFDDGTDQKVMDRRIDAWMKQNRPDAASATPASTPPPAADDGKPSYLPKNTLGTIARLAMLPTPLGPLSLIPGVSQAINDRVGDVNFYRTLGQGVLPLADEGVAGIRSLLPQSWGGTDYNTALEAERKGVKDYAEKHGAGESMAVQGLGALATIPLTAGTGALLQGTRGAVLAGELASKAPGAAKLAAWAANNPFAARLAGNTIAGAGLGGAGGFAGGEGGLENRLENAGYGTAFGGVGGAGITAGGKLLEHGKNVLFGKDNAVADYLRKRLVSDRADTYSKPGAVPRRPDGTIDTTHPNFARDAATDLDQALAEQRLRSTKGSSATGWGSDVMPADVLPGTTEAVMLKSGEDTTNLGRDIIRRQYNKTLPEDVARAESQHGQVGGWFDRLFGPNVFRETEDTLLKSRRAAADAGFTPAFRHNLRGSDLEDALNDPYVGKAWEAAKMKMDAERKPIGVVNPVTNNISSYNTEFLHKLKTTMDDMIKAARTRPEGTTGPDTARIIGDSKNRLNDVIMAKNPEYADAMKKFGDDSTLIEGLRKGREDVFGKNVNELDRGIGKQDIEAYLNDPNVPDAAKDLFRIGGAQALREKLLGSDASKFQQNWADIMSKPNLTEKYQALVPTDRAHLWDPMRDEMLQMAERHQNMGRAMAGSQTARRTEMNREFASPNILSDIVATVVNPSAPSGWRHWMGRIADPLGREKNTANAVAQLLAMKGEAGNRTAVDRIRDLLQTSQGNKEAWARNTDRAARVIPYSGLPGSEHHYIGQPSDEKR